MVNKKIFLGLFVVLSLFVFACDVEQQETPLNGLDYEGDVSGEVGEFINDEAEESVVSSEYEQESNDEERDEISDEVSIDVLVEGISREEVAEHSDESSCWVGYYGYVYDLTDWLNQHPGGAEEILPDCGTVEEFTESYDNRHGQKDTLNRNDAIGELI